MYNFVKTTFALSPILQTRKILNLKVFFYHISDQTISIITENPLIFELSSKVVGIFHT